MADKIIIVEKSFAASPKKLWEALTDSRLMKKWYFDLPGFRPEVGYRFTFTGGPPDRLYVHLCEITESLPEKKLAHTWKYDGYDGESVVTFELIPNGDKTILRLTHTGIGTFPRENPDFDISNFEAGWNEIIRNSLDKFISENRE